MRLVMGKNAKSGNEVLDSNLRGFCIPLWVG